MNEMCVCGHEAKKHYFKCVAEGCKCTIFFEKELFEKEKEGK